MALHSQLPLYKTAYELLRSVMVVKHNMPRDLKKSLGERLVDELLAITVLVLRANVARDKTPHLDELLERQDVANSLLRLAVDLRAISPGQYAGLIKLVNSIGKQAGGWRKQSAASPVA